MDAIIRYESPKLIKRGMPGADPEIFHGRWLMGWLPIVNYTGARGVAD